MRSTGGSHEAGRVALVLLALLAVAGLGAWWLMGSAADTPAPGNLARPAAPAAEALPPVELPAPADRADTLVPAAPPSPTPVAAEPAAPKPVPHVRRRASDLREYVDPAHFAERYAGSTLTELRVSKAEIESAYFEAQQAAVQQLLDAGRAETTIRPRAKDLDAAMAEANAKPHDSHGLIEGQRSHVLPNGELQTESYAVPWAEFTPLYDKGDEMQWLGSEIRRREKDERAKQASGN